MKRPLETASTEETSSNRAKIEDSSVGTEVIQPDPNELDETSTRSEQTLKNIGLADVNINRLEVLWALDNEFESVDAWWPCTLDRNGSVTEDGRFAFTIHYDAKHGYDATDSNVVFLNGNSFYDLIEKTVLRWRVEGAVMAADCERDNIISLDEIVEEVTETGRDTLLEMMESLPMVQQQSIALSYRKMVDRLVGKIKTLKDEKERIGADFVVTADDMNSIIAELNSSRANEIAFE